MSTNRLDRRQFLIASSACALATAAVGPKLFAGEGAPPRRLAVGYAPFEDDAAVMPAAAITSGDGGFISRGARIQVSGVSGASESYADRRAVELHAHYSYFDGGERKVAPFLAWGCSRTSGCQGSPIRFTVPVEETQKISFSVETERGRPVAAATRRDTLTGNTAEAVALPVSLSLQSGEGLKLARGFYIIVPLFDDDTEPRWSSYRMHNDQGRWAMQSGDQTASFEHFVLRIDYAS